MRVIFGLILASVVLAGEVSAQDQTGKKVAFLVGVNQYDKPSFRNLHFAERDVAEMGKELKALGFDVTVLTGGKATRKAIDETVTSLVRPLKKADLMLVMLSGHGTQRDVLDKEGRKKNDAFYCPVDAIENDPSTLLSLSYVIDDVLAPNVGRKLLLVDACRDEPNDPGRGSKGIEGKVIALPEGTAIMFSCLKGQQSFENEELRHGLFTYCLLEGLRGRAGSDGEIAWSDVTGYVNRRMASRDFVRFFPEGRRQEPIPAGGVPFTVLGTIAPTVAPPPSLSVVPERTSETVSKSTGMKLALIPAGEFPMGSSDEDIATVLLADSNLKEKDLKTERPQHRVQIKSPFYLGMCEVTQAEYQKVRGRNPSWFSATGSGKDAVEGFQTDQFPVEMVSWFDAIEFCNAISVAEGLSPYYDLNGIERDPNTQAINRATAQVRGGNGYRLPTEAEWEYACRAGTTTPYHFGGVLNGDKANVNGRYPFGTETEGNFLGRPTIVNDTQYPRNAFGLSQMHGNVWEWCSDEYEDANADRRRVIRGGAWVVDAWLARSALRTGYAPGLAHNNTGFRIARTP